MVKKDLSKFLMPDGILVFFRPNFFFEQRKIQQKVAGRIANLLLETVAASFVRKKTKASEDRYRH